jgi:hypothetical protein
MVAHPTEKRSLLPGLDTDSQLAGQSSTAVGASGSS